MEEDSDPDYAVPPKKRVRQLPRSQLQSTSAESVEVVAHVEQGLVEVDSSASADVHSRRASKRLQNKLFTDPASCVICQLVKKPGYDRSGTKNISEGKIILTFVLDVEILDRQQHQHNFTNMHKSQ